MFQFHAKRAGRYLFSLSKGGGYAVANPLKNIFQRQVVSRYYLQEVLNHRMNSYGQLAIQPAQILVVKQEFSAEFLLCIGHKPENPVVPLDQITEPLDASAQGFNGFGALRTF